MKNYFAVIQIKKITYLLWPIILNDYNSKMKSSMNTLIFPCYFLSTLALWIWFFQYKFYKPKKITTQPILSYFNFVHRKNKKNHTSYLPLIREIKNHFEFVGSIILCEFSASIWAKSIPFPSLKITAEIVSNLNPQISIKLRDCKTFVNWNPKPSNLISNL